MTVPDEAALDDKRIKMAHACRLAAGFTLEQLLAQDDEGDTSVTHRLFSNYLEVKQE